MLRNESNNTDRTDRGENPEGLSLYVPIPTSDPGSQDGRLTQSALEVALKDRRIQLAVFDRSEQLKMVLAFVIGAASVVLYVETTKKASTSTKASSIGSNSIVNLFAAKASVDFLQGLNQKNDYRKWVASFSTAFISALPFSVICFDSSQDNGDSFLWSIFAAVVTQAGMMVLYTLAITQLSRFKNFICSDLPFYFLSLVNLCWETQSFSFRKMNREEEAKKAKAINALRVALDRKDLSSLRLCVGGKLKEIIGALLHEPDFQTEINKRQTWLRPAMHGFLVLVVVIALSLGTVPYTCDSEAGLRGKPFYLSEKWAFPSALSFMFFQYALNFTGAYGLVSTISDIITKISRCRLGNDFTLGGARGTAFLMISPLLAGVIACLSGYTTWLLYQSCRTSQMEPIMFAFLWMSEFVKWSAVAFNAIYVMKALRFFTKYFLEYRGSEQDRLYLCVLKYLDELSEAPLDAFNDLFLEETGGGNSPRSEMETRGTEEDGHEKDDSSLLAVSAAAVAPKPEPSCFRQVSSYFYSLFSRSRFNGDYARLDTRGITRCI